VTDFLIQRETNNTMQAPVVGTTTTFLTTTNLWVDECIVRGLKSTEAEKAIGEAVDHYGYADSARRAIKLDHVEEFASVPNPKLQKRDPAILKREKPDA
jgi:hypothetical protein